MLEVGHFHTWEIHRQRLMCDFPEPLFRRSPGLHDSEAPSPLSFLGSRDWGVFQATLPVTDDVSVLYMNLVQFYAILFPHIK